MCEIMTIIAASAFTALYFIGKRNGRPGKAVFTTMLMFWGAALMLGVDCVADKMAGEPLFDISREDTLLGMIVLVAGFAVYGALEFKERRAARV